MAIAFFEVGLLTVSSVGDSLWRACEKKNMEESSCAAPTGFFDGVVAGTFCAGVVRSPTSPLSKTEQSPSSLGSLGDDLFDSDLLDDDERGNVARRIDVHRVVERQVSMERMVEEEDDEARSWTLGSTVRGALESTQEYVLASLDEREEGVPRYPIVRYMVLGAGEEASGQSSQASYEDALALSKFVSEFVVMLQRGFRLVKHGTSSSRLYVMELSNDCSVLTWVPARTKPGERKKLTTKRRIGDAGVVADHPHHKETCFALTFAPLSERQAGMAPREIHVFEPANMKTKEVLVDGFRLLVERAVHKFFSSKEFRVSTARLASQRHQQMLQQRALESHAAVSSSNAPNEK